jgi:hypothetical protein
LISQEILDCHYYAINSSYDAANYWGHVSKLTSGERGSIEIMWSLSSSYQLHSFQ